MKITTFHNKNYENKHRNTTYRKIIKILDELERDGIVKVKEVNTYKKIKILKENELVERLNNVSLF